MKLSTRSAGVRAASALALLLAALLPASAQLASEWDPPLLEVLQLPPYCQAAFRKELAMPGGNPMQTCGGWFNHFCPGLVALNRAAQVTRPMNERRVSLKNASDHIQYTRQHLSPSCALAADVAVAEARLKIVASGIR